MAPINKAVVLSDYLDYYFVEEHCDDVKELNKKY